MYFNELFDNFDQRVLDYFRTSGMREVELISSLRTKTYRKDSSAFMDSGYLFRLDLNTFLQDVFMISEKTFNSINYVMHSLGSFLENDDNNLNFRDKKSFNVRKINDDTVIRLTDLTTDISFEISPDGVKFYDTLGYIKIHHIAIIDNDIDMAFEQALTTFTQTIANMSSISTDQFDDDFLTRLHEVSFADVIAGKTTSTDFIYPDREKIYAKLKEVNKTHKSASHRMGDVVLFSHQQASLFLDTVKPMFSADTYTDFLRAFNFYYNYNVVMNKSYIFSIDFSYKHKLQPLSDTSLTLTFGDEFTLMFGPIYDKQRNTQFMIHTKKKDFIRTNNMADIYDFILKTCSPALTRIAQKPVSELVWGDLVVLMMDNI